MDNVAMIGLVAIESVVDYRDKMVSEIVGKSRVVFDIEALELDGSAIITLWVDIFRAAKKAGVDIEYRGCSPKLMKIAEVNGVNNILPLKSLI